MLCCGMKRFLSVIFAVTLLLANHVSYAHDKADPPTDTPVAATPEKPDAPTLESPHEPEKKPTDENAVAMPSINSATENVSVNDRSIEVSKKANLWAKYQTIINAIGLVLIGLATYFAYGAWQAGKETISVGERTLQETVIANERAQRAWLTINKTPHGVIDKFTGTHRDGTVTEFKNAIFFKIELKNIGRTPAINTISELDFKIAPKNSAIPIFNTDIISNDRKVFIPQGGIHSNGRLHIYGSDSEKVWSGTHVVYCFIRCEYQTIFDDKIRITRETFKFFPEGTHTVNGEQLPKFFISQVGKQNYNT